MRRLLVTNSDSRYLRFVNHSRDLQDMTVDMDELKGMLTSMEKRLRSASHTDLLRWLCPLNVLYRDAHEAALAKRFSTTGAWLLQSAEYASWVSGSGSSAGAPFCLHGMSGSGKSVLCSVVVQDLLQRASGEPGDHGERLDAVVCYYHFSMKDATRNYLAAMYDTLVRQLLQSCPEGFADVADLAESLKYGHPSRNDYARLCKRLLSHMGRVFLVVDGVDSFECRELERLLAFLNELLLFSRRETRSAPVSTQPPQRTVLAGSKAGEKAEVMLPAASHLDLRLFFTTRDLNHSDVQILHRPNGYDVRLLKELVEPDIRAFTEGQIRGMDQESRTAMGESLQQLVIDRIVEKSDGL